MPAASRFAVMCVAALGLLTACGTTVSGSPTPSTQLARVTSTPANPATKSPSTTPDDPPSSTTTAVPAAAGLPMAPTDQISRSTAHTTGRYVALTFDDGPDPRWTPQVLALLAQYHVHATFCLIGIQVNQDPQLVRDIAAGGNSLCDHTMTHDEHLNRKPLPVMEQEIGGDRQAILAAVPGASVMYYRAPGGNFSAPGANPSEQDVAVGLGMQPLAWSVDPRDWAKPGVAAIVGNVETHVHCHDVVLMHDGGGDRSQTLAALRILLPWLIARGYQFDLPA